MANNKTAPTTASPQEFIASVENERRRQDAQRLLALMGRVTGQEAVMWGPSMVGFGSYHYKYATGREGDALAVGFSPRSANLALYGLTYAPGAAGLLQKLGKHKTGAACLYINKLDDVDQDVLAQLIDVGHQFMVSENFTNT
ncbi:DUF1801 domain-containing protein [Arthrobacter tumbae]|uniref:DUF1801 domain-containing protein n=1 Tax=Arthrobacter tumbae TaxID=163874 RepID=UPI001956247A|nr:DUF1801 domain-containing protein [Arthrobacter tumbae]MBM7781343.1 hypothetical protein [Arthrobacter tumbae]